MDPDEHFRRAAPEADARLQVDCYAIDAMSYASAITPPERQPPPAGHFRHYISPAA
jgi:hypothetical protein